VTLSTKFCVVIISERSLISDESRIPRQLKTLNHSQSFCTDDHVDHCDLRQATQPRNTLRGPMRLLRGWREGGVEKMPLSCTNPTAQEELARLEPLASDKQRREPAGGWWWRRSRGWNRTGREVFHQKRHELAHLLIRTGCRRCWWGWGINIGHWDRNFRKLVDSTMVLCCWGLEVVSGLEILLLFRFGSLTQSNCLTVVCIPIQWI
jgi:hypothetical protein